MGHPYVIVRCQDSVGVILIDASRSTAKRLASWKPTHQRAWLELNDHLLNLLALRVAKVMIVDPPVLSRVAMFY